MNKLRLMRVFDTVIKRKAKIMAKKVSFIRRKATPVEMYDQMISKRGTQAIEGSAEIYLTHHEMEKIFGSRCNDYEPSCACCKAWLGWDSNGKATVNFDRNKLVMFILEGKI